MYEIFINQPPLLNRITNYIYYNNTLPDISEHMCNGVVHTITKEKITKYKTLLEDLLLRDI